jgi:hypothetical protein
MDPGAWVNRHTHLDQIEAAFAALGKSIAPEIWDAA